MNPITGYEPDYLKDNETGYLIPSFDTRQYNGNNLPLYDEANINLYDLL